MFEVAEMLGVRVGERFEIETLEGEFTLGNEGLYSMITQSYRPEVLLDLLTGKLGIKRAPWKPDLNERYYVIEETGMVSEEVWWNECIDIMFYKLGNCYRTIEEAEAHVDKWKAFYASDELLDV
jgi:hypothetical protein